MHARALPIKERSLSKPRIEFASVIGREKCKCWLTVHRIQDHSWNLIPSNALKSNRRLPLPQKLSKTIEARNEVKVDE